MIQWEWNVLKDELARDIDRVASTLWRAKTKLLKEANPNQGFKRLVPVYHLNMHAGIRLLIPKEPKSVLFV